MDARSPSILSEAISSDSWRPTASRGAKQALCSGLMKPDTHLGENARQIEVSDDQTTPFLFC
ncbi:hypothetical protein C0J26_00090 [Pseudomonas baetica]|nr:hypothetical protein C0J26_00090 [Pseudomonas baetica]